MAFDLNSAQDVPTQPNDDQHANFKEWLKGNLPNFYWANSAIPEPPLSSFTSYAKGCSDNFMMLNPDFYVKSRDDFDKVMTHIRACMKEKGYESDCGSERTEQ